MATSYGIPLLTRSAQSCKGLRILHAQKNTAVLRLYSIIFYILCQLLKLTLIEPALTSTRSDFSVFPVCGSYGKVDIEVNAGTLTVNSSDCSVFKCDVSAGLLSVNGVSCDSFDAPTSILITVLSSVAVKV